MLLFSFAWISFIHSNELLRCGQSDWHSKNEYTQTIWKFTCGSNRSIATWKIYICYVNAMAKMATTKKRVDNSKSSSPLMFSWYLSVCLFFFYYWLCVGCLWMNICTRLSAHTVSHLFYFFFISCGMFFFLLLYILSLRPNHTTLLNYENLYACAIAYKNRSSILRIKWKQKRHRETVAKNTTQKKTHEAPCVVIWAHIFNFNRSVSYQLADCYSC